MIMSDQYWENLNQEFAHVKADLAKVIAIEKGIERKISIYEKEITRLNKLGVAALFEEQIQEAKCIVDEKTRREKEIEELKASLKIIRENSNQMKKIHDDIFHAITTAIEKNDRIMSKLLVSQAENRMDLIEAYKELENKGGKLHG